jgi:predicted signal transduction protein with EAL and GGDEF domain
LRVSDCVARETSSSAALDGADPIARLGGDEFIILLPEIAEPEDAARVAERVRSSLGEPFEVDGTELHISSSIGIALYPRDGRDVESLLQKADLALYQAKEDGRNNFRFYTETLNDQARERLTRETELQGALSREEFLLYYQPTVDARSGALVSAEALLRWQHRERGLVPPGEFISLAEETGLIIPLGNWVMDEACAQIERWQRDGPSPCSLSINLSFRQFKDAELIPRLKQSIDAAGIDPSHLTIEFTESALMEDTELTRHILSELKGLGLRSAMDDFGTGYSSLSYLKRLPIDILKMDRSFVHGLDSDKTDEAISKAIITMAHELKLQVTAEGVEREAQLDLLRAYDCDFVQGYLIDRPMPADEFARRWLSKTR